MLRHGGVRGRLTSGRVAFDEGKGLTVYDPFGGLNEYISGARMRSWRVFREGCSIPECDWDHAARTPKSRKTRWVGNCGVFWDYPNVSGVPADCS